MYGYIHDSQHTCSISKYPTQEGADDEFEDGEIEPENNGVRRSDQKSTRYTETAAYGGTGKTHEFSSQDVI